MKLKTFIQWAHYRIRCLYHLRFCSLYPPLTWKQYKAYRQTLNDRVDNLLVWYNVDATPARKDKK